MSDRQGLQGHLDLVCGLDDRGVSTITRQSFRAPLHISKPWLEEDTLIVHVVNQTAGLLAGDVVETNIHVEPGARLLVTSPSASRAHRTPSGEILLRQHFTVATGGWLEFFPEFFIPQGDTTCRQHTRIELETGASLLYIDTLAPGRVASGESFAYRELDWRTDLAVDGRALVRERSSLIPGSPNLAALRNVFPNAFHTTIWLVSPNPLAESWSELLALQSDILWIGVSQLTPGAWTFRLLAADSVTMRKAVQTVRSNIHRALGWQGLEMRKI